MQANGKRRCAPSSVEGAHGVAPCEVWQDLLKSPDQCVDSADATEGILFALALAVEQRDNHTGGHCERLAYISVALGVTMGLKRSGLVALRRGGFLHDVGKVGIPDSILFKPGRLTAEEWVTMRSHTTRGEEICRHLESLQPVLPIIRHHHERWDGSGYPDGLSGEQIPILARILQIADIYDALTNSRPYKPAYHPQQALGILRDETKRGWRDPYVFSLFERLHSEVLMKRNDLDGAGHGLISMSQSLVNLQQSIAGQMAPSPATGS